MGFQKLSAAAATDKKKRKSGHKRTRKSRGNSMASIGSMANTLKTVLNWKPFKSNSKKLDGTAHSGWLWKKNGDSKWERCWFILDGTSLSHYEHHKNDANNEENLEVAVDLLAEGERFIVNLSIIERTSLENNSRIMAITLKHGGGDLFLRARSKRHAREWHDKLEMARVALVEKEQKVFEKELKNQDIENEFSFDAKSEDTEEKDTGALNFDDYSLYASKSSKSIRSLSLHQSEGGTETEEEDEYVENTGSDPNGFFTAFYDMSQLGNASVEQKELDKTDIETRKKFKRRGRETLVRKVSQILTSSEQLPKKSMLPREGIMPVMRRNSPEDIMYNREKDEETIHLLKMTIESVSQFVKKLLDSKVDSTLIIDELVDSMHRIETKKGQYLITEGELDDTFFVIEKGKFNIMKRTDIQNGQVFIDEKKRQQRIIATRGRGAYLGEVSLLHDQPASVSVRSLQKGIVWALTRRRFEDIRARYEQELQELKYKYLDSISVVDFSQGTSKDIAAFADALEYHSTKNFEILVRPGVKVTKMLFVAKGYVRVYDQSDELIHELREGDSFGEIALLEQYVSEFKLVAGGVGADSETVYLSLDIPEFEGLVGQSMYEWISTTFEGDASSNSRKSDGADSKDSIEVDFEEDVMPPPLPDEFLPGLGLDVSMNHVAAKRMGSKKVKSKTTKKKKKGKRKQQATVRYTAKRANKSTLALDERILKSFENGEELTKPGSVAQKMHKMTTKRGALDVSWSEAPPLLQVCRFYDLKKVCRLGSGSFGNVHLIRDEGQKPRLIVDTFDEIAPKYMALKTIARDAIVKNGWEGQVENELCCMRELSYHEKSKFLLRMFHSFADSRNIYLLVELCEGGDLFAWLGERSEGVVLCENDAVFYSACVVNGLSAIHDRTIIYRDLKPENLFIARNGYVKIGDFGFAKKAMRTFTICGTADYMAPEVILGRGQAETVDYWALGVLIYELLNGMVPFLSSSSMGTYEAILDYNSGRTQLEIMNPYLTDDAKSIIKKFLHPKSVRRYYSLGEGMDAFRDHPFFMDLNWKSFDRMEIEAPYVPLPKRDIYDTMPEIEEGYFRRDMPADSSSWMPPVDTFLS